MQSSTVFPAQDELINRRIVAIETWCDTDAATDPINTDQICMPPSVFNAAYLTLYRSNNVGGSKRDGKEPGLYYDKLPLYKLRTAINYNSAINPQASCVNGIFIIDPTCLNWVKCKVEFPTNVACAANVSACFTVHYLDEGDDGEWFRQRYFKQG